jgi:hypothetical protein
VTVLLLVFCTSMCTVNLVFEDGCLDHTIFWLLAGRLRDNLLAPTLVIGAFEVSTPHYSLSWVSW